ncbi:hypothetical protein [Streptomyces chartreusis]|uniref:hypothetical protein n=1 Tax=Streptomyces chartreusis TaxID=1969 RepID=UPI0033CE17D3
MRTNQLSIPKHKDRCFMPSPAERQQTNQMVQSTEQWGGRTPKAGGRELQGRTWDQMPLPVPV